MGYSLQKLVRDAAVGGLGTVAFVVAGVGVEQWTDIGVPEALLPVIPMVAMFAYRLLRERSETLENFDRPGGL